MRGALLVLVLAAAGCGGSGAGDDTGDGDGGGDDIDGGGGGGPDAAPPLDICVLGCGAPADCATGAAGTILDADNYDCDGGACRWTGCNSTTECTTTYNDPGYVCDAFGSEAPTCWPTCTAAADCAAASPILGADNYECDDGKCRWTGCNSTTECTDAFQSPDYRCEARGGALPTCWPTCGSAADCATASPAYDTDNYACTDGICEYTGCNSTAECMSIGAGYVCD